MAAGDVTITNSFLKIEFSVEPDPAASFWSCELDTVPLVTDQGIPSPFTFSIDPVAAGDHVLLVTQTDASTTTLTTTTSQVTVLDPANVLVQIRPTAQMVADLVRTRLVSEGGGQVPPDDLDFNPPDSFTANTYPTLVQAERIIDQATTYIVAQVPGSIAEDYLPSAKHLSALYAAILIEGSYFREQLTDDQVELYRNMLVGGIKGLGASVSGSGSGSAARKGGKVDTVIQRSVMTDPLELQYQMGLPSGP
jgi:hypothetical protein